MQIESSETSLTIASTAFQDQGAIPLQYSARGKNISPSLSIDNISPCAKSIAVTMDDISHPLFGVYNHWLIWNIPILNIIPAGIPHGAILPELNGAVQGIGYGKHGYKGPKPPLRSNHSYQFTVYTLDCLLELPSNARKKDLCKCMEGHILQSADLLGTFQNP